MQFCSSMFTAICTINFEWNVKQFSYMKLNGNLISLLVRKNGRQIHVFGRLILLYMLCNSQSTHDIYSDRNYVFRIKGE